MIKSKIFLLFFLLSAGFLYSQTTHNVAVQNFSFTPQYLTISVGDIVKWTNTSGSHNVRAEDNSFFSGPAAPAPWEFTHTFTTVDSFPYYCEPHQSMGMTGAIVVRNPVGVNDDETIVNQFKLEQNFPNPFNPSTIINYSVPVTAFVTLKVYDILGNEIAVLVNETKQAADYQINFNASELKSGIYFYQLRAGSLVETQKMTLIR
ncbi:MAG: T9SS type A sorting domain-containing protein [Ignavibacteriota bacterium]|jgi:plastocyanin|nr:MAG: T9SS C-terminal target domain-containing protein [Chlorobiota bacterium]MBE7475904.1 T9SS type A sorting domain-containing protein [Ignavibacteriales bacterium]MBV6420375.1 Plastocyanin [Ignavibacteriaceae bacterium]MEB2296769.1 plastocyanin/azurin family copper-binding protein [Ignavibacteria bacterium]QKJ95945.1 MAG: T9SS type A sorting domain-containing protein [Ignavibacteriota bacterium]